MKMINKLWIFMFFILALPLGSSALCQNINPITNVPCEIITPVISCSGNAQLTNINTTQVYSLPMTSNGDGTYRLIFNYGIAEYAVLLCDNSTTTFSVIAVTTGAQPAYYPTTTSSAGRRTNVRDVNYTIAVQLSQYPYADINISETFYIEVLKNMTAYGNLTATLKVTELNGSYSYVNVPFNPSNNIYQVSILYDSVGDYPFDITLNGTGINRSIASGTILVRKPFNVIVKLFNKKDLSEYRNNYGYITAEFPTSRKINYDLEPFFYPIKDSSLKSPVFHANYVDGVATLRLFENATTYRYRFADGISFNTTYDKPNYLDSSRTEMFLGDVYTNSSTMLQFVLTEKDKYPYRWLLNWIMIIGLILTAMIAIALFFVMADKPQIAFIFGILFTAILIGGRILLWILKGW